MKVFLTAFLFLSTQFGFAAQIVTEAQHTHCEELQLFKDLKIYKDPTLFLPVLSQIYVDPANGWDLLMNESPLLTTLRGTIHVMRLGSPQEFKSFGGISRLYELADSQFVPKPTPSPEPKKKLSPKDVEELKRGPLIVPIKICSEAYAETLGFVLETDLKTAQVDEREEATLPPSTRTNPIPKLRK
jgi:hypothetical protein